jgi:hypothetical protein
MLPRRFFCLICSFASWSSWHAQARLPGTASRIGWFGSITCSRFSCRSGLQFSLAQPNPACSFQLCLRVCPRSRSVRCCALASDFFRHQFSGTVGKIVLYLRFATDFSHAGSFASGRIAPLALVSFPAAGFLSVVFLLFPIWEGSCR